MRGKCRHGDACTYKHDETERERRKRRKREKRADAPVVTCAERDGGLLRRLLQPDIDKEHDILLQAIRYIVRTSFLAEDEPADAMREKP